METAFGPFYQVALWGFIAAVLLMFISISSAVAGGSVDLYTTKGKAIFTSALGAGVTVIYFLLV